MSRAFIKDPKNTEAEPKKIIILEFKNSESLMLCIENLYKNKITRSITGDLYKYYNMYRLILFIKKGQIEAVSHFCGLCDNIYYDALSLAKTQEYAQIIQMGNIIKAFGGALVKFASIKGS